MPALSCLHVAPTCWVVTGTDDPLMNAHVLPSRELYLVIRFMKMHLFCRFNYCVFVEVDGKYVLGLVLTWFLIILIRWEICAGSCPYLVPYNID